MFMKQKAKKTVKIFSLFVIVLSMVFMLTNVGTSPVQADQSLDEVVMTVAVGDKQSLIEVVEQVAQIDKAHEIFIEYETDHQGNVSGPMDFTIDDGDIYLLDSTKNRVIKSSDGKITEVVLKDMARKITARNGILYTLNNDLSITRYDDSGMTRFLLEDRSISEAVVNFQAIGEYLYISASCPSFAGVGSYGSIRTYKLDLADDTGIAVSIESFEGSILDENTIYKTIIEPKEGKSLGNKGSISITDLKTGTQEVIRLSSEYWLLGATYLGIDESGNHRVKMSEATNDRVEQTIRYISPDGRLNGIRVQGVQEKYGSNHVKVFNNNVYELRNLKNSVDIVRIASANEKSVKTYRSKLSIISESTELTVDKEIQTAAAPLSSGITRAQIMSNARSFHRGFFWTITDANLRPLTNWLRPRFVTGPGTYEFMPYCWGGFDSRSSFEAGLQNGGRVGNINSRDSANRIIPHVPNTFGLDCSAFVSRAWATARHATITFYRISRQITWDELRQGDALNRAGHHIHLFSHFLPDGRVVVYEATTSNSLDRVANTIHMRASLTNYVPIRFNNVLD